MKMSFWALFMVIVGLIGITVINAFQSITTTNEHNYYLLREVTESAMLDAIDLGYYRLNGDIRIVEEKFVENFVRRFAESFGKINNYNIKIYDVVEEPPKVSLILNANENIELYNIEPIGFDINNRLDAIIETNPGNESKFVGKCKPGWRQIVYTNPDNNKNGAFFEFVPKYTDDIQVLIVGGGGGGATGNNDNGGGAGGGAGGVVFIEKYPVIAGVPITGVVGVGGCGGGSTQVKSSHCLNWKTHHGQPGSSSKFGGFEALGGGGGMYKYHKQDFGGIYENTKNYKKPVLGSSGGSGGGGGTGRHAADKGTTCGVFCDAPNYGGLGLQDDWAPNLTLANSRGITIEQYGNDGGDSDNKCHPNCCGKECKEAYYCGTGGGGGAGGPGGDAKNNVSGAGGLGMYFGHIFGEDVGHHGWFASGGGGGGNQCDSPPDPGDGGNASIGGGSSGACRGWANSALPNTGGGGGGGGAANYCESTNVDHQPGGEGGSGVVIVRYYEYCTNPD